MDAHREQAFDNEVVKFLQSAFIGLRKCRGKLGGFVVLCIFEGFAGERQAAEQP